MTSESEIEAVTATKCHKDGNTIQKNDQKVWLEDCMSMGVLLVLYTLQGIPV